MNGSYSSPVRRHFWALALFFAAVSPSKAAPPSNDLFANRTTLSGPSGSTTGTCLEATKEAGEPLHHGNAGGRSVWWTITLPTGGSCTLDTSGSSFDSLLAVYTGNSVSTLVKIASDDDSGSGSTSRLTFPAQAGTTYHVAVDGYGGASGSINLAWTFGTASMVNDNFAQATLITGTAGTIAGNNASATAEPNEPAHANSGAARSLWWKFTPSVSSDYSIDTNGSDFDTLLHVYSGTSLSSLTSIDGDDDDGEGNNSSVTVLLTSGVTYHIAVDGYTGATGNIKLNWASKLPTNDNFASATLFSGRFGSNAGSSIGATVEVGEPGLTVAGAAATLWYRWTASEAFPVFVKTEGSSFDTVLNVYHGTALNALTLVGTNDNGGPNSTSRLEFGSVIGRTYYFQVLGSDASASGAVKVSMGEVGKENIPLLPDLWVMADVALDYLYGWTIDQTEIPGRTLLRLTTTTPNTGAGPLELRGTSANPGVVQRIYNSDGTWTERLAGSFTFHPTHGHLHFDNWVQFHLREVVPGGGVGPIVVSGHKTSFAVIDLERHDNSGPTASQYSGGLIQGLSVGWRDVYDATLDGQWIDVTGVQPGQYWLEGIVDPENSILESDETNNANRILITYAGSAPPNNNFASSLLLTGSAAAATGSNITATLQSGEPQHGGLAASAASVWYRWVAPAAGPVTITTRGSTFDTVLAVYTGTAVTGLVSIAANDNAPGGTGSTSQVSFNATSGVTYQIAVAGAAGGSGLVEIAINPLGNDNFANARVLTGNSGSVTGTNWDATAELNEPEHMDQPAGRSVWYRFTGPLTGDLSLRTVGSNVDTRIALYTGSSLQALTLVAEDDDSDVHNTSSLTTAITSGTVYYIAVDSTDEGVLQLAWNASTGLVPTIVTQPTSQNVVAGDTLTLRVAAVGSPTLTYEWRHAGGLLTDGGKISGATTATLSLAKAAIADGGGYQCTVRNGQGQALSSTATVLVISNPRVFFADHAAGGIGGVITVPLLLQSQGNENSVQGTLSFATNIFSNPLVHPGADATGATITLDSSQTASGRLGITIALPAGQTFAAGLRTVGYLRLLSSSTLVNGNGLVTPVGFGLAPTPARSLSATGAQLPLVTAAANVTLQAVTESFLLQPQTAVPGQIRIGMSGLAGRTYTVEASPDLHNWAPAGTLTTDYQGNGTYTEIPQAASNHRFYRIQPQ